LIFLGEVKWELEYYTLSFASHHRFSIRVAFASLVCVREREIEKQRDWYMGEGFGLYVLNMGQTIRNSICLMR